MVAVAVAHIGLILALPTTALLIDQIRLRLPEAIAQRRPRVARIKAARGHHVKVQIVAAKVGRVRAAVAVKDAAKRKLSAERLVYRPRVLH